MIGKLLPLAAFGILASCTSAVPMTYTSRKGTALPYRFLAPENPVPGRQYPLVVFLHGAGERGYNNRAQLRNGAKDIIRIAGRIVEPFFMIAPQCPKGKWWAAPKPGLLTLADAGGENPIMESVMEIVGETTGSHPVDSSRIYLTGLSMGGFGTFDLLSRAPDVWAAAMPVCGVGDPKTASRFRKVPIRIFHGEDDKRVPAEASRIMAAALEKVGADVSLTTYPGVGHNSWDRTYGDPEVIRWMFSQKKGS